MNFSIDRQQSPLKKTRYEFIVFETRRDLIEVFLERVVECERPTERHRTWTSNATYDRLRSGSQEPRIPEGVIVEALSIMQERIVFRRWEQYTR